ncbi:hypothetical protein GGF49_003614 [Coemansia sp. RSA 1853]|nr:hypothetical protein GGF49_003614 [Coemansia sp. RSA 1853]
MSMRVLSKATPVTRAYIRYATTESATQKASQAVSNATSAVQSQGLTKALCSLYKTVTSPLPAKIQAPLNKAVGILEPILYYSEVVYHLGKQVVVRQNFTLPGKADFLAVETQLFKVLEYVKIKDVKSLKDIPLDKWKSGALKTFELSSIFVIGEMIGRGNVIATHAGSWYTDDREQLDHELQQWLDSVPEQVTEVNPVGDSCTVPVKGIRAIIGPHAGFSYSGANAAYGYKCIDTQNIKRVFLLGPSHHAYLKTCALSQCTEYSTPLGNIRVDQELVRELQDKGEWRLMSTRVDQDEHSLEMHLPYIYKVFESRIEQISLVPIMVGNLAFATEQKYGKLLAPYLADPENLFIISSDFCHWGSRFGYTFYQSTDDSQPCHLSARDGRPNGVPIWESIQRLDSAGMDVITQVDHAMFRQYLDDTSNTICGNHPIGVLLAAVNHLYPKDAQRQSGPRLRFVKYDQSSKVRSPKDSSVSYASAYLWLPR